MGTSNWQNVSWCVQAIMQIEPKRVLDVGIGFGRWGVILREFGEVWFGRITPDEWSMRIEGIEAHSPNVMPYHDAFYDKIYIGDALDIIFDLKVRQNLVILGDVLEHFVKSDGERILDHLVENSDYVLINLPIGSEWPQEDMYDNPYEEHKAVWEMEDFDRRPVVSKREFRDFEARPFAGFVLSKEDPRGLASGLFGSPLQGEVVGQNEAPLDSRAELTESDRDLVAAMGERLGALEAIRNSATWKMVNRLRGNSVLWSTLALLARQRGQRVTITHLANAEGRHEGGRLAISKIESSGSAVLWDFLRKSGDWSLQSSREGAFSELLVTDQAGANAQWYDYGQPEKIHLEVGPRSGLCRIEIGSEKYELDLQSAAAGRLVFDCVKGQVVSSGLATGRVVRTRPLEAISLSEAEIRTLECLRRAEQKSLAVYSNEWAGIRSSTLQLFDVTHVLGSELDFEARERFLQLVEEAKLENLVLSGGAMDHLQLCHDLRKRSPQTKVKVLWHGNFMQVSEEYAWRGLRAVVDRSRKGLIHTVGVVKEGMAEFFEDIDIPSAMVLNYVSTIPEESSTPAEGGPHFGLWLSNQGWRKLPHAMAAATRRTGGILHVGGGNRRLIEFSRIIGLRLHEHGGSSLSPAELDNWMRRMHLNLYVTLSECCPMLPLESLAVGTPCLVGPTSHLFRDDPYLFDRLVVPFPDSSAEILKKINVVLEERDEIIRHYARYAIDYNARAAASVAAFLER